MSNANEKLVHRLIVLSIIGLLMGVGASTLLTNSEIEKLLEPSAQRTVMILVSPLAGLGLLGYSLALKEDRQHDLRVELLILTGAYLMALSPLLPTIIWHELGLTEDCGLFSCAEQQFTILKWALSLLLVGVGALVHSLALTGRKSYVEV